MVTLKSLGIALGLIESVTQTLASFVHLMILIVISARTTLPFPRVLCPGDI